MVYLSTISDEISINTLNFHTMPIPIEGRYWNDTLAIIKEYTADLMLSLQ